MAAEELSNPGRTSTAGSECRWIAADNTVNFVFQRKDYTITSIVAGSFGNRTRINVNSAYNHGTNDIGKNIYIFDVLNRYTGVKQIVGAGTNYFEIKMTFVSNSIGFVNDLARWPNYYLDLKVYDYRSGETIGFLNFTASTSGVINIDLSALLRAQIILNTRYKYEMVNKREEDWALSFGFKYSEVYLWTGSTYQATTLKDQGDQWYVAKAARQIGDEFGQNLRLFEIYPEANIITDENEALFLDEGVISTYFKGYPWSLSFLFGEQVTGVKYRRVIEQLDVNQTVIAGTNETEFLAEVDQGYVNRLSLRKSAFNYDLTGFHADAHFLHIWIEETDTVTDDDLGGGGSTGGGGTNSGIGGGDASLLDDGAVGG
tara:strand:- start:10227 stop:11345 length:1119 start_codon:yes stop_codon:yes gene_type:complete